MPQLKSAVKRLQQTEKRTKRNKAYKSRIKTAVRKVRLAAEEGRMEEAQSSYRAASSLLDKAGMKGILHKKAVSRRKSRLAKLVGGTAGTAE